MFLYELVEVDVFKEILYGEKAFDFVDVVGFDDFLLALDNFLKDTEVVGVLEGDFTRELRFVGLVFGVEFFAVVDAFLAGALFALLGFGEVEVLDDEVLGLEFAVLLGEVSKWKHCVEVAGRGDGICEIVGVLELRMVFGVDGRSKLLNLLNLGNKLLLILPRKVHMLKQNPDNQGLTQGLDPHLAIPQEHQNRRVNNRPLTNHHRIAISRQEDTPLGHQIDVLVADVELVVF